jgi:hypothetical protein
MGAWMNWPWALLALILAPLGLLGAAGVVLLSSRSPPSCKRLPSRLPSTRAATIASIKARMSGKSSKLR